MYLLKMKKKFLHVSTIKICKNFKKQQIVKNHLKYIKDLK